MFQTLVVTISQIPYDCVTLDFSYFLRGGNERTMQLKTTYFILIYVSYRLFRKRMALSVKVYRRRNDKFSPRIPLKSNKFNAFVRSYIQ